VAESLGCIGDRRALPALWRAINDTSSLVRCYVAEAIGKLGSKKDVKKLEKALRHETSDAARIGFYQALYVQGQRDVLQPMLMLLQSNDYRVRCATANTLSEIIANKSDSLLALRTLRTALKQELTVAAKSSIRAAIRSLGRR
jgi:HEAT repeat protein